MRKSILLTFLCALSITSFAQFGDSKIAPISFDKNLKLEANTVHEVKIDKSKIEDLTKGNDLKGPYQVATTFDVDIQFDEFELKTVLPSGDKLYQLEIKADGALAMMLKLDDLSFSNGEKLWVTNPETKKYIGQYSEKDIHREEYFLTSIISGDRLIVEFLEPKEVMSSDFRLSQIQYFYKGVSGSGFGGSEWCMLNVGCSEGTGHQEAIDATCKIVIPTQQGTFFCTGTLVNNTANDGTPMVLTANHCSQFSFLGELKDWEYHFDYQSSSCSNPAFEPGYDNYRGSKALAYSGSDNGEYSSDFLLVQLLLNNNTSTQYSFKGWDRNEGLSSTGISVHHPAGDIKKISVYTQKPTPASYQNNVSGTHLEVYWSPTVNGHSVTEGGSSGGGLFNVQGRLIGTLTGGAASCSNRFAPDYYGRLSRHWNSYGTAADRRIDVWLDHQGTGETQANSFTSVMKSNSVTAGIGSPQAQENVFVKYFDDKLVVKYDNKKFDIKIINLLGEEIFASSGVNSSKIIDLSTYPSGVYIAQISNEDISKPYKFLIK